jgi:glycine/D-amino acid oxidase-like deaminating enzyme
MDLQSGTSLWAPQKQKVSTYEPLKEDISSDVLIVAGTFGETKDGLGYVGIPKGYENTYFILGFGGNGITFGLIAAEMLKDMLLSREVKNQDLFSFDRLDRG